MTDKNQTATVPNLPVMIHAQYVKDISFENPSAPHSLRAGLEAPKTDVNINLEAKSLEDDKIKGLYEVGIRISATATRGEETLYIADVTYAAAVSMPNVAEEHHHPLLLVEIPKMLFPFARKIVADLVQDGGYVPLLVGPVDFAAMYLARFSPKADELPPKSAVN